MNIDYRDTFEMLREFKVRFHWGILHDHFDLSSHSVIDG